MSEHNTEGMLPPQDISKLVTDTPRKVRRGVFIAIILLVVGYLSWQLVEIVQPPELVVIQPAESVVVHEAQIYIEGYADPSSSVTINNEVVLPDESGKFKQEVTLKPEIQNTFVIEARKRYSNTSQITRTIIYRESVVQGATDSIITN